MRAPAFSFGTLRLSSKDLEAPETIVQIGLPPRRIDIITGLTGLESGAAWGNRVVHAIGELPIPFLGREDLIRNKHALGRARDIAGLNSLEG